MNEEQPELLTSKEIAAHLKVASTTVMRLFHAGIIPAEVAIGHIYRFSLPKVLAALAEHAATKPHG